MTWRAVFSFVLVMMIAASVGMAIAAAERSPGWFLNPGAAWFLREAVLALVVYAGVIIFVVAHRGDDWDVEMGNAALFGSIAGLTEGLNVALENGIAAQRPAVQIAAMLLVFALWGVAGARTSRELNRFRPGVIAAVMSAGVCMVIGVTAGFAIELFIGPPSPDYVSTWDEFKRSGWLDAHAFGIANTLDSGFTHLWMGPVIALVTGSAGAWIGVRTKNR